MKDIRCGACGRKLGAGIFIELQIKCSRCKAMNYLRSERSEQAHHECQKMDDTGEKLQKRKYRVVSGGMP